MPACSWEAVKEELYRLFQPKGGPKFQDLREEDLNQDMDNNFLFWLIYGNKQLTY